jgi:hypothetical protein
MILSFKKSLAMINFSSTYSAILRGFICCAISFIISGCTNNNTFQDDSSITYTVIELDNFYDKTIAAAGFNIHQFTTTSAGAYTIAITNPGSDIDWVISQSESQNPSSGELTDNVFDKTSGRQYIDTTDEVATITLSANTQYYLIVDEWSDTESYYTISVISP